MILSAMILIPAIAGGCKRYSQAEWDAGRLYWQDKSWQKCRHRVAIVARDMMKRGETFELVFGEASWNGELHVRIEKWVDGDLRIIDPTWPDRDLGKLIITDRWEFTKENQSMRVISFVNHALLEIGDREFYPSGK
jgi:hypothetical protein